MYKVLIVDDEPPFLEKLERIVTEYGNGCQVIGKVYSGRQALELIEKEKPDIIFTDISMPVMDGIGLARRIREDLPDVYIVVISGYSSFEYAREAFRADAFDYLLKPIEQETVNSILDKLITGINEKRHKKCYEIFKDVIFTGNEVNAGLYQCRFNNYVLFFISSPILDTYVENIGYLSGDSKSKEFINVLTSFLIQEEDFWVYSSEKADGIIIFGLGNYRYGRIQAMISGIRSFFNNLSMPVVIGVSGNITDIGRIREEYFTLEDAFYKQLTIGCTQIITTRHNNERIISGFMTSIEEGSISRSINERNWANLKSELVRLFNRWEKERCPRYWVEKVLKQITGMFEKQKVSKGELPDTQLEKRIDEVIRVAKSFGELLSAFWSIISLSFITELDDMSFLNSNHIFDKIDEYVKNDIARTIGLLDIGNKFGISQSYICNLFRKKTGMSFIEYVTVLRLEKAKELLKDSNKSIKDVAELVGYSDQHYFSRVFRNITGITPSAFQKGKQ